MRPPTAPCLTPTASLAHAPARHPRSEWQNRRVVVSKDVISFALVDDDTIVDEIPLAQVDTIQDMLDISHPEASDVLSLQDMEKSRRFHHSFQIATIAGGHNSGRSYCLQAASAEQCRTLVRDLRVLAVIARDKAEAKTRFEKSQDRVRAVRRRPPPTPHPPPHPPWSTPTTATLPPARHVMHPLSDCCTRGLLAAACAPQRRGF